MTNFEYYIKGGRTNEGWRKFYDDHNCRGTTTIDKYNNWLLKEHEEPILDDIEKKYLSNVIKPFRDRVTSISKEKDGGKKGYYIEISLIDYDYVFLPYFKESTKMYTGMKLNQKYSLKELGL